jgi:hypothetical protein
MNTELEYFKSFIEKKLEEENNSKFYPRLERVERKLDAIIDWINWFAKENQMSIINRGDITDSFIDLPTIDIEDCEKRDKDSE